MVLLVDLVGDLALVVQDGVATGVQTFGDGLLEYILD